MSDKNTKYTNLYFIRHCAPDFSKVEGMETTDMMPLSKQGVGQSEKLAVALLAKEERIDRIYASGFARSYETAKSLAQKTRKKIFTEECLEEINWNEWMKIKYFHMSERERVAKIDNYHELDRKLDRAQARAREIVSKIYHQNIGKNVAIFTHGNVIRSIITSILNADVIGFLSLDIYHGAISKVVIDHNEHVKIAYTNYWHFLDECPTEDIFITAVK